MPEDPAGTRRGLVRAAYLWTFLTGVSALVYQIVWQKYLGRLLGSDSLATATVLGVFLAGLSLGYFVWGRLTLRVRRLLAVYGLLEGVIGLWVILFPLLFQAVEALAANLTMSSRSGLVLHGVLFGLLLIGVPTVCMGATVPMLTRGLSASADAATGVQARVYGVNAAGACVGALAAGFLLIPRFGLPATLWSASLLNLGAGAYFWLTGSRIASAIDDRDAPPSRERPAQRQPFRGLMYLIAFISGFYFMTLESVLIRFTGLSFGSSAYSFALIVAVFVLSIALGAFWVSTRTRISPAALFLNQASIAVSLMVLFVTLDKWPYWAHLLRIRFPPTLGAFVVYQLAIFGVLVVLLVVPAGCMGATLPLTFHALKRDLEDVGRRVGSLFGWNAAGNLLGGVVGGFLVFRFMYNGEVFLLAVGLVATTAVLASLTLSWSQRAAAGLVLVGTVVFSWSFPAHDPLRFAVGTFRLRQELDYSHDGARAFYDSFYASRAVLAYRDDPEGSFAVVENPQPARALAEYFPDLASSIYSNPSLFLDAGPAPRAIVVNGKADSNTLYDRDTLVLLAHLPALLAEHRDRVLVVGLGTGITAGELTLYDDIRAIEIAEIAPAVVDFLPLFEESTHRVQNDPRVRIRLGDAFQVLRQDKSEWDIIISQPSNPWMAGVDQLFSLEYYRLARERLAEGGVFLQWTQRYATNEAVAAISINTLRSVFPNVRVFREGADDLLLATTSPVGDDAFVRAEAWVVARPEIREALASLGIDGALGLLEREHTEVIRQAESLTHLGLESLDHPRLHYLSGLAFFRGEALDLPTER